ncbi:hypothetical protein Tco_1098495, partial [Tanacetum coccineum]
ENVNYLELIWEDLAYQIDHKKEKRSRYDGIVCGLKFVRICEDYQEYRLSILKTMLTEAIKQSESYEMFIKYSTGQIPLKKSRGKVKRKTSSKRRVKKKVILSADDNIIFDDADTALEFGKSISKTEAKEAEAARQVHATLARIVTESILEPTKRRKSSKVTSDHPKKLKGVPSLTPSEQEAADIMQALKEIKKIRKRQSGTGGSSEGTSTIPEVPDESIVIYATSSEGTEDKLDNEEKDDKEGDADDEDDETESDEDDIYKYKIRVRKDEDEEMINAEVDDSNKGDKEVTDATKAYAEKTSEVKDDAKKTELPPTSSSLSVSSGFGDQFLKLSSDSSLVSTVEDTTNAEINSLLEVKIQSKVPHTQSLSMLSVLVFMISEPSVFTPVQEYPSKAIVTTLPHPSVSTTPSVPQQTTTSISTPTITTNALIITTAISESDALSAVQLRVTKLEKDVYDLKKIDLSIEALAALKTQVPYETPKGKALSKGSKTGKSTSTKEPVEEPIAEVVMDDAGDDVFQVLKTGEYDLWSMRMEQYLTFTDHALWEVIVNGDSVSPIASASASAEGPIPPKTVEQKLARKNELKAKSTLMLAIPDEQGCKVPMGSYQE